MFRDMQEQSHYQEEEDEVMEMDEDQEKPFQHGEDSDESLEEDEEEAPILK